MNKFRGLVLIIKDISKIAEDFLECHFAQLIKPMLKKLVLGFLIFLIIISALIAGLVLILWGVFIQLSLKFGQVYSAYILGGFLFVLAFITFFAGRKKLKN